MQILILMNILSTFVEKKKSMEDVLAINVKRICKEKGLLMKELAAKLRGYVEIGSNNIYYFDSLAKLRNILHREGIDLG